MKTLHLFGLISTGISTQLPQTSFIEEPESLAFAEPNATAMFVWEMENCILNGSWRVKLLTELFDLYPTPNGPIKNITDYNATAKCIDNSTIITLSIIFNENVLENAEYVMCRVTRRKDRHMLTSMVNFTTTEPTTGANSLTEATLNSESTTIESTSISTTKGTGCKQCVHFSTFVLCLLVANFIAFSWQ